MPYTCLILRHHRRELSEYNSADIPPHYSHHRLGPRLRPCEKSLPAGLLLYHYSFRHATTTCRQTRCNGIYNLRSLRSNLDDGLVSQAKAVAERILLRVGL